MDMSYRARQISEHVVWLAKEMVLNIIVDVGKGRRISSYTGVQPEMVVSNPWRKLTQAKAG